LSQEHAGYLEVVDARSARPTGQVVRWDVVHNAGVWHASVSVLIVDAHEHLVLQQRGESESWGRWDVSVTGHVDVGENDVLAALRETREELGLVIGAHRLWRVKGAFRKHGDPSAGRDRHESRVSYIYRTNKKNREQVKVFIVTLSEAEKRQIVTDHKGGALAVQWVALSEAAERVRRNPEACASALKQLFADDAIFFHI
jgi:8-oxo-dGTP pyrophosphatase MutT (NUDIX family)